MSWNIFEVFETVLEFIGLFDGSSQSENINYDQNKVQRKSRKYTVELWSGGFLLIASILFLMVFKNPLPENYVETITICILIAFVISFIIFFSLYHLGMFYFKSLSNLLMFIFSFVSCVISILFFILIK